MTHCLFDAVGTLIYPKPPAAEVYYELGRRFGCQRTLEDVRVRLPKAVAKAFGIGLNRPTSEAQERQTWETVVAQVFPEVDGRRRLFEALWDHFSAAEHWGVYEDVADCFQRLAALRIRLHVASNFDSRLTKICRGLKPLAAVDSVFVSSTLGWRKPNAEFFREIQRRMGAAGPIWMIGDDWQNDVMAARSVGWRALWLQRGLDMSSEEQADSIRTLQWVPDEILRARSG